MGVVIGPSRSQYQILQGKASPTTSKDYEIKSGRETFGSQDVFLLPAIKDRLSLQAAQFYWTMNMGKVDTSDIFLIDSQVDAKKVAQFADCVWYDPMFTGTSLMDTRGDAAWSGYLFGQDPKAFEMAYYNHDTPIPGITPKQFKKIDFSKLDLDGAKSIDSETFLKTYSKAITEISSTPITAPGSGSSPISAASAGNNKAVAPSLPKTSGITPIVAAAVSTGIKAAVTAATKLPSSTPIPAASSSPIRSTPSQIVQKPNAPQITNPSKPNNKDPLTGLISGEWKIDTKGDATVSPEKPPGGILFRSNQQSTDRDLRFAGTLIYKDKDQSKTFNSGDVQLGNIKTIVPSTGLSGTFKQTAPGSNQYGIFSDALNGALAGTITFTTTPW
jgi:hypothetical protein